MLRDGIVWFLLKANEWLSIRIAFQRNGTARENISTSALGSDLKCEDVEAEVLFVSDD